MAQDRFITVGTGEALALGMRGYADALFVHDRTAPTHPAKEWANIRDSNRNLGTVGQQEVAP